MADAYTVERVQHVDAAPGAVLEHVIDLRRWRVWSPWEDLDPDLRRTYGGPGAGVGAWYEWHGGLGRR
jgi:hypothetical protein